MALQQSLVLVEADAIRSVANEAAKLLARVNQALEHNSDLSILWSMPATFTFTAANASNTYTATAHGQANGQKVRVSSSGVLPAGLSAGVDYYVIGAAANTFQLSASLGGAAVDITTDGTGTHTCQPVPSYMDLEANGNLKDRTFTPQEVSNAIGSLDWVRKLLTNQAMTGSQGDHLGNLNKLAGPLG
jgi:hypothetical protein